MWGNSSVQQRIYDTLPSRFNPEVSRSLSSLVQELEEEQQQGLAALLEKFEAVYFDGASIGTEPLILPETTPSVGFDEMSKSKSPADGSEGDTPVPSFQELVDELIAIGRNGHPDPTKAASGFGVTSAGSIGRNERAMEIGQLLNEMDGEESMLSAHHEVSEELGSLPARELEAVWRGIGTWQA